MTNLRYRHHDTILVVSDYDELELKTLKSWLPSFYEPVHGFYVLQQLFCKLVLRHYVKTAESMNIAKFHRNGKYITSIRHCLYHFSPEAHWARPLGMVPFRPRGTASRRGVFLALLLLLSGNVAENPGPICHPQVPSSTSINLASLNVRSAVGKSALIHNIIADDNIDVFALSETWIQQDAPSVFLQDPAPEGYRIIHVHRKITADGPTRGGGLAIISRDSIPVRTHPLAGSFNPTSFEIQLARVG